MVSSQIVCIWCHLKLPALPPALYIYNAGDTYTPSSFHTERESARERERERKKERESESERERWDML